MTLSDTTADTISLSSTTSVPAADLDDSAAVDAHCPVLDLFQNPTPVSTRVEVTTA